MTRIKSVGVMSFAKIAGLGYFALGLLLAPLYLFIGLMASIAGRQAGGPQFPAALFVVLAILSPFLYGGMGFNGDSVLRKFSQETGGRVIEVRSAKDTDEAFAQIANELRTQYLLGYTPSNTKLDGTFRKIDVKVRAEGAKVNARRGYYAPQS